MVLTPAERAKRYREKLKENPVKYEIQRQKQLKRLKKSQKKVSELSEEEKHKQRKIWREQKRKQKENKKTQPKATPEVVSKKLKSGGHSLKIKHSKVCKNYKKALNNIRLLKLRLDSLRKRFCRAQQKHDQEIKLLKNEYDKVKIRNECMEISLRNTYNNCNKYSEKRLLKQVVINEGRGGARKVLGLKGPVRVTVKEKLKNKKTKEEIEKFFIREDVSRCTSGKRECKTRGKKKCQIRYTVDTLLNLFKVYKNEGGKCSFTTFFRYKPFFVISPSANSRDTCLCIKHSNMNFLFVALKSKGVVSQKNIDEIITAVSCNIKSNECMFNKCDKCKIAAIEYNQEKMDSEITWFKWNRVNCEYEKSGKKYITKKTTKQQICGTVRRLIVEFEIALLSFKTHVFIWKHQQHQYRTCINTIKDDEIVILCDFSENYNCKFAEEVQAIHFGASKNSITLHSGVIYFKDKAQSFVTISDNNCHEPHAIWAHLFPIIKFAKEFTHFRTIHFFSDGPSSQYRQKKNFYLLTLFTQKLNLFYSTWSFSESGHGKSVADGIGGAVKRQLDKKVAFGLDVTNGLDAHNIIQNSMKSVKSFYVTDNDIKNVAKLIPDKVSPVPGTLQLHQIISQRPNQIQFRQISCFCGELKGLCSCYCPKNHTLLNNQLQNLAVNNNMPRIERCVADFFCDVNREIDNEVITDERVVKSVENNDSAIIRSGRVNDKEYVVGNDVKIARDETCGKSAKSEVMNDEWYSKSDSSEEKIDKEATEIIIDSKDCIYDIPDDSLMVITQEQNNNVISEQIMENIDDIPSLIFPLDDIALQPFESDIISDSTNPDPQCMLPSTSKNMCCNFNDLRHELPSKRILSETNRNMSSPRKRGLFVETDMILRKPKRSTPNQNKAIRTVIKRQIECNGCKENFPVYAPMIKCMACKEFNCMTCSSGQQHFDYICLTCFGE